MARHLKGTITTKAFTDNTSFLVVSLIIADKTRIVM